MDIESIWEFLGKRSIILFGKECASVAVWMCFSLILRFIVVSVRLTSIVPHGLIFSCPYFIQVSI